MKDKKRADRAFQTKRDIKIEFKEKKLNSSFDRWLSKKYVEEVTIDGEEEEVLPPNSTRN